MFTAAAFIPSPPLLVPELSGRSDETLGSLREAALEAGSRLGALASRWLVLGTAETADSDAGWQPQAGETGSFAGFGAPVCVALAPSQADGRPAADCSPETGNVDAGRDWPLAALIAGWVRTMSAPEVTATVSLLPPSTSAEAALAVGVQVRRELDAAAQPVGLLIVGDGARTLTDGAPGAFDPRSAAVQSDIDRALSKGDRSALAHLDAPLCEELGISGRPSWQAMAGAFTSDPSTALSLYCDAPYGVGYHVGMWLP
ncbi:MAG: hypothetical protein GX542_00105 [Rhodococcus sp.]|nr:hypothetical protein [Rhodococcus sp. (in: high G+C Gram-positive bacteria)]